MKLTSKIYLGIGAILVVFMFVTAINLSLSKNVRNDVQLVIHSAEILRLSEALQKSMIDAQTGLRGYMVAGNESFLEPYYTGLQDYQKQLSQLRTMVEKKEELQKLNRVDSIFRRWQRTFAETYIELGQNAGKSEQGKAALQKFREEVVLTGVGKLQIDTIRQIIGEFELAEDEVKSNRLNKLEASLDETDMLSLILTTLTVFIGILTAYFLGNTIKRRLSEMVEMARSVARGNFDVNIQDGRHDEISQLSDSLNVMARRLKASFTALDKKNRELDQFAYVVSHDLKAPLRAINSLAEWIQEDLPEVAPDVQRNLELLRGRVFRMENLINGILEYSRIGRKELTQEKIDVRELLQDILETLSPEARFQVQIQDNMPVLQAERILLNQVFSNLLSNAFKYHDKEQGHVQVSCSEAGNFFKFTVQDDGPGIPQAFHSKIFTIFQTIEARDTRESTGVGLAIVKKIIEEKHGQIWIESEPGAGTAFVFTWPKA